MVGPQHPDKDKDEEEGEEKGVMKIHMQFVPTYPPTRLFYLSIYPSIFILFHIINDLSYQLSIFNSRF